MSTLRGRTWDAVIDTSAYTPKAARLTAELLQDAASHYTFISMVSVYSSFAEPGMAENAPVGTLTDEDVAAAEASENISPEAYGLLKACCERVVEGLLTARSSFALVSSSGRTTTPTASLLAAAYRQGGTRPS